MSEQLVLSGVCQGWGWMPGLGLWSIREGPGGLRTAVCCLGLGVRLAHTLPMVISPFSVPYLTVSAESKLFTLFLFRGALCPIWTAYLWDISLCPTAHEEDKNQAA